MEYRKKFAEGTANLCDSIVKILMDEISPNNLISFSGGCPSSFKIPYQLIKSASDFVLTNHSESALQYGEPEGCIALREFLSQSISCSVDNILISSGGQQALDLVGRLLFNSGDRVGIFAPTYMGIFRAWNPLFVNYVELGGVSKQLDFDKIENELKLGLKGIYIIPNHDNPTTQSITEADRIILADLVKKYDSIIIEDDAYYDLCYNQEFLPSFYSLIPNNVISIRTFSKVIAPGLRVAWIAAEPIIIKQLSIMKLGFDFHACTLSQLITLEVIRSTFYQLHIADLQDYYRKQSETFIGLLAEELDQYISWNVPTGGFFVWGELKCNLYALDLLKVCLANGVSFVPGSMFYQNNNWSKGIRFCISEPKESEMRKGLFIIKQEIEKLLETTVSTGLATSNVY